MHPDIRKEPFSSQINADLKLDKKADDDIIYDEKKICHVIASSELKLTDYLRLTG